MFYQQGLGLATIIVCLSLITQTKACFKRCPRERPFAYLDGSYCCRHSVEAYRPSVGDNPPCDGGPLEVDSRCCKDDDYKPCPYGENICRSSVRETCYLDGEKVTSYPNHGKGSSQDLCMALSESSGDSEAEVEWVKEYLYGISWRKSITCDRIGRGERDCSYWAYTASSGGTDVDANTATAGVSQALASVPPGRRCELPRRWRTIRGRQKCRRPRRRE